ncbi:MAG: alpha/beta fold hydrolase [Candidatus Dormibacteria bacterium]
MRYLGARRVGLALAALATGGSAAVAARLAVRRRELRWAPPLRAVLHPYLSVQLLGSGSSPVILLHPIAGSADYFGSTFDELADPGPLVVPDLLGYGSSPVADDGYGLDQQLAAVVRSLDQLEVREPALWVGHGLGAVVALRAALSRPERTLAAVAISPLLYRSAEAAVRRWRRLTPLQLGGPLERNLAQAIYGRPGVRPRLAGRVAGIWQVDLPASPFAAAARPSAQVYSQILDGCVFRAEGGRWLEEISKPVHLVLPIHDQVPDAVFLAELAKGHSNVTITRLPFGDHRLPLTHPDGCVAALDRFRRARPPV